MSLPCPRTPRSRSAVHLGLALLLVGLAGCGERASDIVPGSAPGRRVLERAMAAWQSGRAPGMLEDGQSPQVQVVDSFRVPGQRLLGHRVVGELATERARTFSVELVLDSPAARPMVRFLLVGIDPVLVFRDRDYELLTHFEHKMDPAEDEASPSPPAGGPETPGPSPQP